MKISTLTRNAMVDAVVAKIDGGGAAAHLYIRTGSAPTNTTDADSGTLLATLTFTYPGSFGAASGGTATAASITDESNIPNSGTAAHFRIKDSAGVVIIQGSVGTSGADLNLNSVALVAGGTVHITSGTLTQPAGS